MKYILSVILFFTVIEFQCFAQDTIYISKTGVRVADRELMDSYEFIRVDQTNPNRATISTYFKSGKIKSKVDVVNERSLKSNEYKKGVQALSMYNDIRWLYDGIYQEWYMSGKIRKKIGFRNAGNSGAMLVYWENGNLKRKEVYNDKNWKMVSGECFDIKGKKIDFFPFYSNAVYDDGVYRSLDMFYYSKISYPARALNRNAAASIAVFTQFDNTGKVVDAFVRHPVDEDLDKAAIALAKSIGSLTKPACVDNKPVAQQIMFTFNYNLPIYAKEMIEKGNGNDSVYIDKNGYSTQSRKRCSKILLFKAVADQADNLFYSTFDKKGTLLSSVQISKSKTLENIRKNYKSLLENVPTSTIQMIDFCKVLIN